MRYRLRFFEYSSGEEHFIKEFFLDKKVQIPRKGELVTLKHDLESDYVVLGANWDYAAMDTDVITVEFMCRKSNYCDEWWEQ